jgi:hypothetical protein
MRREGRRRRVAVGGREKEGVEEGGKGSRRTGANSTKNPKNLPFISLPPLHFLYPPL